MKKYILLVCSIGTLFLLPACQNIKALITKGYIERSAANAQIEELESKHVADTEAKIKEVQDKLEQVISSQEKQIQIGANKLYGANEAFKYYQAPVRLDRIINNRVTEAQSALGKAPTYEAIQEENARLKNELDEKKTTLDQLTDANSKAKAEATRAANETISIKGDLEKTKTELLTIEQKYIGDSKGLQEKLKSANDKIQAALKKQSDNSEATERMKTTLMKWCGIGAAIALVGAIYSPVGKGGLATIAGALGAATAAIPFIEGWMVLASILLVIIIVAFVFLYKHHVSEKTNDNLINAIQDAKKELGPNASVLKNNLKAWNAKYTKDELGNVITVPDNSVEEYIQSKLMKFGQLENKTQDSASGVFPYVENVSASASQSTENTSSSSYAEVSGK